MGAVRIGLGPVHARIVGNHLREPIRHVGGTPRRREEPVTQPRAALAAASPPERNPDSIACMPRSDSGSHGTPSSTASNNTKALTRSGARSAASTTMRPPIDSPTSTTVSIPRWSTRSHRSSACVYAPS